LRRNKVNDEKTLKAIEARRNIEWVDSESDGKNVEVVPAKTRKGNRDNIVPFEMIGAEHSNMSMGDDLKNSGRFDMI
jgi:hypothetical protein